MFALLAISCVLSATLSVAYGDNSCGFTDPSTGTVYDFSSLAGETILGSAPGVDNATYVFKFCGVVDVPAGDDRGGQCAGSNASLCQLDSVTGAYLSTFYSATPTAPVKWRTVNELWVIGVQAQFISQRPCGELPFTFTFVTFVCDKDVFPSTFAVAVTADRCTYTLVVRTSLACKTAPAPSCGYVDLAGHAFDFTALSKVTVAGTSAPGLDPYNYLVKLCGVVDVPKGDDPNGYCTGTAASLCQLNPTTGGFVATLAQLGSAASPVWSSFIDGAGSNNIVATFTNGMPCGYTTRTTNITLVCDPRYAVPPNFVVSTLNATDCTVKARIYTSLACLGSSTQLLEQ